MMMTAEEQFDLFRREYDLWHRQTQALPLRLDRRLAGRDTFEIDLDHLIDYVQPIFAAAIRRSTQFDYPKVANEYLHDLNQIREELDSASFGDADRKAYSEYLMEFHNLLSQLGSLPVPSEGHLGFRKQALQAFRFLIDEYGFAISDTSPIAVRFTARSIFVNLSHSPECPMDSVLIGKTDNEELNSSFILDDFAYVAGLGLLFDYGRYDLQDPHGIADFLRTAATLIHHYGDSLLKGSAEAFSEFQGKADERERSYIGMMEGQHSGQS